MYSEFRIPPPFSPFYKAMVVTKSIRRGETCCSPCPCWWGMAWNKGCNLPFAYSPTFFVTSLCYYTHRIKRHDIDCSLSKEKNNTRQFEEPKSPIESFLPSNHSREPDTSYFITQSILEIFLEGYKIGCVLLFSRTVTYPERCICKLYTPTSDHPTKKKNIKSIGTLHLRTYSMHLP